MPRGEIQVRRKVALINSCFSSIDGVWRRFFLYSIPYDNVHGVIDIRSRIPTFVRIKCAVLQECTACGVWPVGSPSDSCYRTVLDNTTIALLHYLSMLLIGGGVSPGCKRRTLILGKGSSDLLTNRNLSSNLFCSMAVFVLTIQYSIIPVGIPDIQAENAIQGPMKVRTCFVTINTQFQYIWRLL